MTNNPLNCSHPLIEPKAKLNSFSDPIKTSTGSIQCNLNDTHGMIFSRLLLNLAISGPCNPTYCLTVTSLHCIVQFQWKLVKIGFEQPATQVRNWVLQSRLQVVLVKCCSLLGHIIHQLMPYRFVFLFLGVLTDLTRKILITKETHIWTYKLIMNHHESIHFLFRSRLSSGSQGGGAGVYPSSLQAKAGLHPGLVASSLQDHIERQTTVRTHIYGQF